jgi:hypothetical protein
VYQAYIDRIGARDDLSVPYAMLAALVVGLVVLGNLATIVPARRARRDLPPRSSPTSERLRRSSRGTGWGDDGADVGHGRSGLGPDSRSNRPVPEA